MARFTTLPRALLFDLDGTLADTIVQLAMAARQSAEAIGVEAPDNRAIQEYVGNGVNLLLIRTILGRFDVTCEDIDPLLLKRARSVFNEIYAEGLKENFRLYDGVLEGLNYFKSLAIKLAVVTNKPQIFAVPLLKHMGVYSLFDYVLGGEVLPVRKPDPLPLEHCLLKLGVDHSEAMMVGDSDNDVLAGINAGVGTVFFTYGYNRHNLSSLNIDYSFDSFYDLIHLIENLAR